MKIKRAVLAEQIGKQTRTQRHGHTVNETYFTIVNPAAGGGRCGKLAPGALDRLRAAGLALEVRETRAPGDATRFSREAYAARLPQFYCRGRRRHGI